MLCVTSYILSELDIDECLNGSPCDTNAYCMNLYGSFACLCNSGYSGDGFSCEGKVLF